MEWPKDVLDAIWAKVRESVHPGLKRRQCNRLRSELMQKWYFIVLKPFVESHTGDLRNRHPEGNFMDTNDFVQLPLVLSLIGHWNLDVEALDDLQNILYNEEMLNFGSDLAPFREDWKSEMLSWRPEDWWPNCIQDLEYVLSTIS